MSAADRTQMKPNLLAKMRRLKLAVHGHPAAQDDKHIVTGDSDIAVVEPVADGLLAGPTDKHIVAADTDITAAGQLVDAAVEAYIGL